MRKRAVTALLLSSHWIGFESNAFHTPTQTFRPKRPRTTTLRAIPDTESLTQTLSSITLALNKFPIPPPPPTPLSTKLSLLLDTIQLPTQEQLQAVLPDLPKVLPTELLPLPTELSLLLSTIQLSTSDQLQAALADLPTVLSSNPLQLLAISVFGLGAAFNAFINSPDDYSEAPFAPGSDTYDPKLADEFYAKRPLMVLKRVLRLASSTALFNTGVLFDWLVLGKLLKDEEYTALRKNEPRRAKEALILVEQLGPTFIKLGQALSIRTDILPASYALELRQLQDSVPPFDSEEARAVIRKELGVRDLSQLFDSLSDKPVASASIGQVYRGKLKDGKDVAVKVQRPGILGEIGLDLYVLRLLTPIQTKLQNAVNRQPTTQEDIDTAISLVDEWGRGFVAETDYQLEAANTIKFGTAMRNRGLDAVCAPSVVEELVRDKVLVTEWVEGTRLDRDASTDVPRLCGVAINAYLTMLLDTGVLHCDPHPGNLLRTTDGKLCILDWGMTLGVPSNLQYGLLEFIAHINTENYDEIPQDFINLGFSPENVSLERLQSSGITEGISFAFRQLSQGGGPKKMQERVKEEFLERYGGDLSDIELRDAARAEMLERMESQLASEGVDVKGVTNVMEEMSRRNRELFSLPPYVLYVARAFSTLEGIGLSIDEDYAIIQECYPYLARRLFTDKSPRAKAALRAMLGLSADDTLAVYNTDTESSGLAAVKAGVSGHAAADDKVLSPNKLMEMTDNFASYTAATATVDRDGEGRSAAAKEFTKILLDKDGSTLQEILIEEAAKLGDATTRSFLRQALVESTVAKTIASTLRAPKNAIEGSEQLSSILPESVKKAIIDAPAGIPQYFDELLGLGTEDKRILSTAQELREVVGSRFENQNLRSALAQNLSDGASIVPSTPEIPEGLQSILGDAETRDFVIEQLGNVPSLGRRFGAELFRRAAYRAMVSPVLPDETKKQLADVNNRFADTIEPLVAGNE